MIGVGFIIGILQDSTETALNSSTDVLFTAVCMEEERKTQHNDDANKRAGYARFFLCDFICKVRSILIDFCHVLFPTNR